MERCKVESIITRLRENLNQEIRIWIEDTSGEKVGKEQKFNLYNIKEVHQGIQLYFDKVKFVEIPLKVETNIQIHPSETICLEEKEKQLKYWLFLQHPPII